MATKAEKVPSTELVLTGDPAEDFSSFLKSKAKPYDFGIQLILKYTTNRTLYKYFADRQEDKFTRKKMLFNIKIISNKWLKK